MRVTVGVFLVLRVCVSRVVLAVGLAVAVALAPPIRAVIINAFATMFRLIFMHVPFI